MSVEDPQNDPAKTKLSNRSADPAQTTDLPASSVGPQVTTDLKTPAPAVDTNGETGGYEPRPSLDPNSTGMHAPSLLGGTEEADAVRGRPSVPGYELLGELGRGGMGVVYKARQIGLDRLVALKMVLAGPHASPAVLARFAIEAQAIARFQHPNLVQVFDVGTFDEMPYFSLEYVEGGTLSKKIAREPQAPRYAAGTVEQLARAMQYAHARGIAHRDLKPANILIAPDGTPKITDFGLAKQLEGDSGQTQSGQVMGTPSYMAPEQAEGRSDVGAPADVYALGAILYDLLTGRPPFHGSSVLDTLEMVRTREPVPPSELTAKLPRDLETICLKCLQKDVAKRYASAGDLADDLRRYLDGRPIVARPVGRAEQAWRWAKRKPALASLAGLAIAFVVALLVLVPMLFFAKAEAMENAKQATESAKQEGIAKLLAQQKQKEAEDATAETKVALEAKVKALDEAYVQRNGVLGAIIDIVRVVDGMKNRVSLAPIRLGIIGKLLKRLDEIRPPDEIHARAQLLDANVRLDVRATASAYSRIGGVYFETNDIDKSEPWLRRTYDLLKGLADADPTDHTALLNFSNISHLVGDLEWQRGNGARAWELHVQGAKLRAARVPLIEKLIRDGAQKPDGTKYKPADATTVKYQEAESLVRLATTAVALGDPDTAAEHALAADKALTGLFPGGTVPPGQVLVRDRRITIQDRLALARFQQGRTDEADRLYRDALKECQSVLSVEPKADGPMSDRQLRVIEARLHLGDFLLMTGRTGAAAAEYATAFETVAVGLTRDPDDVRLLRSMVSIRYSLMVIARKRSGFAAVGGAFEAARHFDAWRQAYAKLASVDPADVLSELKLMLALGRAGRAGEAEMLAVRILSMKDIDPQTRFQAVCGLSVAAGGTTDRDAAARCKDRAFAVLGELVKGWKARGVLELDPDLETLRADPRFAPLLKPTGK